MPVSPINSKPPEANLKTSGLHALTVLPTGTGRIKAYCRGTYTSITFGYVQAADPTQFVAFSSLTAVGANATEEVFLEVGHGVQIYVNIVGASGAGAFIGLSGAY